MRDEDTILRPLKIRILILAGYLASGETMTADQDRQSVGHLVAEVYSDKSLTPAAAALIAVELACFIDEVRRDGRLSIAP